MIYLDSSALLKLLFDERESEALQDWLDARAGTPAISSEVVRLEVVRATRRLAADVVPGARRLVGQLDLIPVSTAALDAAANAGDARLRSLDAIHLASAASLGTDLSAFVVYDTRLSAAAAAIDLPVAQPGA